LAVPEKILFIKLSALGDFVQAMAPAATIRVHHKDAKIVLLTTAPYADLGRQAPYFDEVWIDERPGWSDPLGALRLGRRLREARFDRVYDFQTRLRSSAYFWLMRSGGRPEWSGIAPGASHPHANPDRDAMHTLDKQEEQLRMAGVNEPVDLPDLSWAAADILRFHLPHDYVLLIPGGSARHPAKRWPIENYAALAKRIVAAGLTPIVIGGSDERSLGRSLTTAVRETRDLTGQTGFGDIVALGRGARRTVGNDTGPMHLAVAGGAPATVLYSAATEPGKTAPRGSDVVILRRPDLADLDVDVVAATVGLDEAVS
jgi:ADP-heptose:LPS heptosyltransferase